MMLISGAGNKREFAARVLGGTPSVEEIVQKVAELEYIEEVELYKLQRAAEYPDFGTQLDYIYHNGVDAWKADIVDPVKAKYAKVAKDTVEIAARRAQALFAQQVEAYKIAKARVAQYQLSVGVPESTGSIVTGQEWNEETLEWEDVTETFVIPAIPALEATVEVTTQEMGEDPVTATVANPIIVKDDAERADAQVIIDATPVPVKDHVDE